MEEMQKVEEEERKQFQLPLHGRGAPQGLDGGRRRGRPRRRGPVWLRRRGEVWLRGRAGARPRRALEEEAGS